MNFRNLHCGPSARRSPELLPEQPFWGDAHPGAWVLNRSFLTDFRELESRFLQERLLAEHGLGRVHARA